MKHKVITTEQGKVVVDETAEIYENDFHLHFYDGNSIISQSYNGGVKVVNLEKGYSKILYTINFSIDKDIPMVVVEDIKHQEFCNAYTDWCRDNPKELVQVYHFEAGYKTKEKQGVYSEEDLRKVAQFSQGAELTYVTDEGKDILISKFIQSLNQEHIELEIEEYVEEKRGDGNNWTNKRIKTNRDENGQLMAYVKQ